MLNKCSIPKELFLETPGRYDEIRFHYHLIGVLTIYSFKDIYSGHDKLFKSFFIGQDHQSIAIEILKYIIDTLPEHVNVLKDIEIIKRKLILSLYESGFFG